MKDKLLIIGASGQGKDAVDIAIKMKKWETIAFLDDNETVKTCMGLPIIGRIDDSFRYKEEADFFVAIGNNSMREKIQEKLKLDHFSIVSLIHPGSTIGMDTEIGRGTIIKAGAVINSATKIGSGCIINTNSTIAHDNLIEDYIHISPGANLGGTVRIGKRSWICINSTVINNISICNDCKIGAGTVVVKDITVPGTYVGVPARRI